MGDMSQREYVELEMAYTDFHGSCRDPLIDGGQWLRQCRRMAGHTGPHASGFPYLEWGDKEVEP